MRIATRVRAKARFERGTAALGLSLLLCSAAPSHAQQTPAVSGDRIGQAMVFGDFNGDGMQDLAVAARSQEFRAGPETGAVLLFTGTEQGLVPGNLLTPGPVGMGSLGDEFGATLAVGDFDGDRFDDLAVGAPGDTLEETQVAAGSVFLFRGTMRGLVPSRVLTQGTGPLDDENERGDRFGSALSVGDFNGDGRADLAVGAPGEQTDAGVDVGVVFVFDGRAGADIPQLQPNNLLGNGRRLDQATDNLGTNEASDRFGSALAAGDFDGDGRADLAIGAPGEAPGDDPGDSGIVFVFRGTRDGLVGDRGLEQELVLGAANDPDAPFQNEAGDRFGAALATGDFNGDGKADLVVGAPGQASDRQLDAGIAFLFSGTVQGLQPNEALQVTAFADSRDVFVNRRPISVPGSATPQAGDRFGISLTTGDFDGDRRDDLAIGAPGSTLEAPAGRLRSNNPGAGRVFLFRGTDTALQADRIVTQSAEDLGDDAPGDEFGFAMGSGDTNNDGVVDIVIGAPGKLLEGTRLRTGVVYFFGGTSMGLRGQLRLNERGPFIPIETHDGTSPLSRG